MDELTTILAEAATLRQAFDTLTGRILNVDTGLPNPRRFIVKDCRSDYFIGLWRGTNVEREFFAPYDLRLVFSVG